MRRSSRTGPRAARGAAPARRCGCSRTHARRRRGAVARCRAAGVDGHAGGPPALIVVPRHPQRFDEVAKLDRRARRCRCSAARCSGRRRLRRRAACCSATPWARWRCTTRRPTSRVVGGSLQPLGGHNLIEAAARWLPRWWSGRTCSTSRRRRADAVAAGAAMPACGDAAQRGALAAARAATMRAAAAACCGRTRGAIRGAHLRATSSARALAAGAERTLEPRRQPEPRQRASSALIGVRCRPR